MITPDQIKKLFRYCEDEGVLYWKKRQGSSFLSSGAAKSWNTKYSDKPAGYKDNRGCIRVLFNKKYYKAHRLIWAIVHGEFPIIGIDHINGDPSDNHLSNIRLATQRENMKNTRLSALNKTGIPGVSWRKKDKIFAVTIGNDYVGWSACFLDACALRKSAEIEHGYHENHGRQ